MVPPQQFSLTSESLAASPSNIPTQLFVRGSILRSKFADKKSPIAYGFEGSDLPVYFNQNPVLSASGGGFGGFGGGRGAGGGGRGGAGGGDINGGLGQDVTPNAVPVHISPWDEEDDAAKAGANQRPAGDDLAEMRQLAQQFGIAVDESRPRVVLQFPSKPEDMLLSGTLANGQYLANRAAVVDVNLGKGHVVMFAIRPFWRWQTQGTYSLGFNAIMNWNALDAGKEAPREAGGRGGRRGAPSQDNN